MEEELSNKVTELVKKYNEFRILKKECEELMKLIRQNPNTNSYVKNK